MKTVMVTGGAGFLGSHLCLKLLNEGNEVLCVDNFYTGRKSNIRKMMDDKNFEIIRHDITWPLYIEADQIYNLACPASPPHYQFDPVQTTKTSVMGAINVLGTAKRLKIPVLQASTSEVYGDPEVHPQPESYKGCVNTIGIRACYSDDTEVLTNLGWKKFSELHGIEKVAALNDNQVLSFENPTGYICYEYEGDMIHFCNRNMDLLVTPNHKMVVKKRNSKKFELVEAQCNIEWNKSHLLKFATMNHEPDIEWKFFNRNNYDLRNSKKDFLSQVKMDLWLEFMGYYLSEGSCDENCRHRTINDKQYNVKNYRVTISQSKKKNPEKWKKINRLLEKLPFSFSYSGHQFVTSSKQLYQYLSSFGLAHEKFIDRDLMNVSKRQLSILLQALIDGDGSVGRTPQGKESVSYYSCSNQLMADIQEILLKLGMWGNMSINRSNEQSNRRLVHSMKIVNPLLRSKVGTRYPKPESKRHKGKVYCVTVPSRRIFVRRNGKVTLCGNCYDEGKRCAETLFFDYYRQYGVDIKVIRIFNTYGPNMCPGDGRVVSNFIVQALKGEDITIYGDGSQTRSFCFVSDLIDGMTRMMNSQNFPGPVNLGNPTEITILELAEGIIRLTNSKSNIIFMPLPKDDPTQRKPVIDLAMEKLNWKPHVPLEKGLARTIEYFDEELKINDHRTA